MKQGATANPRRKRTVTGLVLTLAILIAALGASAANAAPLSTTSSGATPPTASFTSSPGTAGQAMTFDASASNDPNSGGSITNYSWDFGDGSTDSTSSATDTHTYAAAGTYTVTLTVTDVETDTASTSRSVTVAQPPTASFTFAPSTPTTASSVSFDGSGSNDPNSGGSITSYLWNYGDGSAPGTGATPSHTYASANTYTVTLTVTDSEGGQDTTSRTVVVNQPPTASFTFTPPIPTAGSPASFDGTSSSDPNSGGSITGYSWDFGDGTTGTGATPSHTYASAGTYTVTLTVTDSEGDQASTSQSVAVDQPPTASFTATPSAATAPASVSFNATASSDPNSGGSITGYSWDFGDGTTGTGATTSHTYASAGSYTVTLTVTDAEGGQATATRTVVIYAPPVASFSASTPRTQGQPVHFDASASSDPNGGSITHYSWDFGDGVSASGKTPSHQYASAGSYPVTLTVTDSEGGSDQSTQTITVYAPPSAVITAPASATRGQAVTFDGTSSSDPNAGGSITGYAWNFGDGGTSSLATPSHTFNAAGTFVVTLTITDSEGATATTSQTITVYQPPTAAFTFSPHMPAAGSPVSFDGSSSSDPNGGGSITGYAWDFGDGSSGTGATPSHAYANGGIYTVTLTVTDAEGGTATTSSTVTVSGPVARFTSSPAPDSSPTTFDASSSTDTNSGATITSYAWTFSDGGTATGVTPSHSFASPGSYTVTLTITDSLGQSGSTSQTVAIPDAPATAAIGFASGPQTVGNPITFSATRTGDAADQILGYDWHFGDGQSASGPSLAQVGHTYHAAGTYTVVLTITDQDGSETTSRKVTVGPATTKFATPTAVFSPPTGREGVPVTFDGSHSSDPNPGGSLTYHWDFGDGGVGGGAHPKHTFRAGHWTVALTVTDSASGLSNSISHPVVIADEAPRAAFTAPVGRATHRVAFRGRGSDRDGTITGYHWSFGDGAHARGARPAHTYAKAGRYRTVLTVTDSSGQTVSVAHWVVIGAANACLVPALHGKTFVAAQTLLRSAQCGVTALNAPKKPSRGAGNGKTWQLVVVTQTPRAGSVDPHGTNVRVKLAWRAMR